MRIKIRDLSKRNEETDMKKELHLICNAHIDPVWQWEWEEGAAAAMSTFRCAARFCREFDGYIFCHNESLIYRWVEEYEPALFAEIQELVKLGKWHIMGGWYLQPDCNMPDGESFARHALISQRYFKEKFGIPRQSGLVDDLQAEIFFEPTYRNVDALRGLEGFSHLWLIFDFSLAHREGWSPTVRPPRLGGNTRVGVFASRDASISTRMSLTSWPRRFPL